MTTAIAPRDRYAPVAPAAPFAPPERPRRRTVHPLTPGAREPAPPRPEGSLSAEAVPAADTPRPIALIRILLPLVMVAAMIGMVLLMVRMAGTVHPMMLILPVMLAMGMMGMFAPPQNRDPDETRRTYLRHLNELRRTALDNAAAQRAHEEHRHPAPGDLWALVPTDRLWERGAEDADALHVRLGTGPAPLCTPLEVGEQGAPEDLDPVCAVALRHTVRSVGTVPDLPVVLNLAAFGHLSVAGPGAGDQVRAMIAQLVFHHGPEAVGVEVRGDTTGWAWVKWLPHARAPHAAAYRVLVVDGVTTTGTEDFLDDDSLTCVIEVGTGAPTALRTRARDEGLALTAADRLIAHTDNGREDLGVPDAMSPRAAATLARATASCRRPGHGRGAVANDLPALLGLDGPDGLGGAHPPELWRTPPAERLTVPVGVTRGAGGPAVPVTLDLRESAEGGMGPHGLCIGATGSGKSELLRTLVVALAATHSPEQLNFVLVDFKGGATFLGLERLPHTSAVITNLQEEAVLVERMHDAISGELHRRQEILRAAGGLSGVAEYEALRARRPDLEPLPALVIVVDEFSELLSAHPDFADLFVAVGRLGRSLHVHLLLASQRLEEGRLRGLDSHLSYRIGLRTFSAAESRQVLGVPDAHSLPRAPGAGFLRSGPDGLTGFQAAYISGPLPAAPEAPSIADAASLTRGRRRVRLFDGAGADVPAPGKTGASAPGEEVPHAAGEGTATGEPGERPTVLEAVVDAAVASAHGRSAHRIWLPPLPARVELAGVVESPGRLQVAVGVIDRPYHQRQDPMILDFSVGDGHLALAGGPKTGKTTALRTVVTALAATHTTARIRCYIIDSGRDLATLARLPHVAGRAGRGETERARRVLDEVTAVIEDHPGGTPVAHTFLVLDGWHTLSGELEDRLDQIARIVADGPAAGVHVLISTVRWSALRPAIRDLISHRLELRLAEAMDSLLDRKAQQKLPAAPGRGLTADCEPVLWAAANTQDIGHVTAVAEASGQQPVEPLRELPERLDRAALAPAAGSMIPLGVGGPRLTAQGWDITERSHLVCVGSSGSGKSTLLAGVLAGITELGREAARIVLLDPRRAHLGAVAEEMLAAYAANSATVRGVLADTVTTLRRRLPGQDITPARLAARDWWTGPEIFLVVDDADLIDDHEFAGIVELLPHGRDIGLHLVIARKSGGFSRAAFRPLLSGVRDQNPAAVVLDSDRDDGTIFGVKPAARAPGRAHLAGVGVLQVAVPETGADAAPSDAGAPGTDAPVTEGNDAAANSAGGGERA
ncbi:type VII secretion protein EccCa [Corynebacterium sp. MSK006]|uniref:type VII secretion protein EccCa n=1 Tax=Corynebacterium sp. MSK006 TaxID=3050187 RepID=UPI00254D0352|nr:type VII secretion protein EccCa [Corynebacterium sp. MSK006]MDK8895776.1 type VII secretion protein EccCa [Corynebacterium sp. MSK006]